MALAPTIRCFIALRPSEEVARKLFRAAEDLDLSGMRRVSAEDMHVTLKFLGDIEHAEVARILDAIRQPLSTTPPFELEVTGLGFFPRPDRPRVLVAHTTLPQPLTRLVDNMEESMAQVGFRREGRAFRPHLTLGRFRKPPHETPELERIDLGGPSFDVNELVLMESVRRKTGASYAQMGVFDLG